MKQRRLTTRDLKPDVGGHARPQQGSLLSTLQHDNISHNVLHRLGGIAHLGHAAAEATAPKAIDGELGHRPDPHVTDIGFVDIGPGLPSCADPPAMVNRLGAWNDATTACPSSMLRAITTPSTGERDDRVF